MPGMVRSVYENIVNTTPPPPPVDIGTHLMWYGDSQSYGYGAGALKNHATAMCRIMETKGLGPANVYTVVQPDDEAFINGLSGRSLAGSRTEYDGDGGLNSAATYLHTQESGNQLGDGGSQDTAAKFKALIKAWAIQAKVNSASVVHLHETAFSFGREGESGRNWDTYNTALREAKTELLAESSITLYISEVDRDIKLLQAAITNLEVWLQSYESNPYHYKSVGNLMVALSAFKALNITVTLADLADITEVSTDYKNACLNVIGANP